MVEICDCACSLWDGVGGCWCPRSLPARLTEQSALSAQSATGPKCPPGLPQKILTSRACSGLPRPRVHFCDQGSWGRRHQTLAVTQGSECLPSPSPPPQLRRSPIKKVRKSLALDIVDEDVKLMMSTLPKPLSLVRGLGEKRPGGAAPTPPQMQRAARMASLRPSASGALECEDLEVCQAQQEGGWRGRGSGAPTPASVQAALLCLSQKGLFGRR